MTQFDWPPRPIPGIEASLRDVNSKKATFRRNAAVGLGRAGEDRRAEALLALERLIEDPAREVRIEAIYAAASLGASELAARVRGMLGSDDPDVRIAALDFLARAGGQEDAAPMASIASADGDPAIRCKALEALEDVDTDACRKACRSVLDASRGEEVEIRTAISILGSIGERGDADAVAAFLGDSRRGVAIEAASALAHVGDARGLDVLLAAADGARDAEAKTTALEALCRMGDERVTALALRRHGRILGSREESVVWTGILARSGDGAAMRRLREIATGRNTRMAALALRVAGLCSLREMIGILESFACRRSGEDLVAESIEALALMRGPGAIHALEAAVKAAAGGPEAAHAEAALEEARRWPRS